MAAVEQGTVNAAVINIKNMHGEVTFNCSSTLAQEIGANTGRLDLSTLLPELSHNGLYLIARQVLFYDPKLARHLGHSESWVSPMDQRVVDYNLEIAREAAELGFDEIQFDYVRFPDGGELLPVYEDRYTAISSFLQRARMLLSGKAVVSADVFGRTMWSWNTRKIDPIGQSLEEISTHVDFISPMLYPSHYNEERYKNDPYLVVKDALTTGRTRIDTPFRPFLQAFDRAIPPTMTLEDYIKAQVSAAIDNGADGYLFWHPACDYASLYKALAER